MTIIPKEDWLKCHICSTDLSEMVKKYGGSGIYKTQCFEKHLKKEHNISINDYFEHNHLCECGICGKKTKISKKGSNFYIKEYACGRNPGLLKWSRDAKMSRKGENNPMFNKTPWNKGLSKETSKSIDNMAKKRTGKKHSIISRIKQSVAAKNRKVHGHTGCKHSKENIEKFRQNTLMMIKEGRYKHTNTMPMRVFRNFLNNKSIKYEEETILSCWSFDFYLQDYDVYIEIDGDYFHSNPKIYPYGPKTKTQKVNKYRDDKKNKFCEENSIRLVRIWESEILGDVKCVEKKLRPYLE